LPAPAPAAEPQKFRMKLDEKKELEIGFLDGARRRRKIRSTLAVQVSDFFNRC